MESYMDHWTRDFHSAFIKEQDRIIREAIIRHGFDPDDIEFLKIECQLVTFPFDNFQHLFYRFGKKDKIRIISIEAQPTINMGYAGYPMDVADINKCSISAKYY